MLFYNFSKKFFLFLSVTFFITKLSLSCLALLNETLCLTFLLFFPKVGLLSYILTRLVKLYFTIKVNLNSLCSQYANNLRFFSIALLSTALVVFFSLFLVTAFPISALLPTALLFILGFLSFVYVLPQYRVLDRLTANLGVLLLALLTNIILFLCCFFFLKSINLFGIQDQPLKTYYVIGNLRNFGVEIGFNLDYLSLPFIFLTIFVTVISIISAFISGYKRFDLLTILLVTIELFLFISFLATDLWFFYFGFESIVFPMFILINLWGSRARRGIASYYFFFYTIIGSLLFLATIIYLNFMVHTTVIYDLYSFSFSLPTQNLLLFGFFFAFAIKIPLFPFHIWLPEAHVEAPTPGSIMLAGIILKLGIYGFIRVVLPICPHACYSNRHLMLVLGTIGFIYSGLVGLTHSDIKKVVAYSSVVHSSFAFCGLFGFTTSSLKGVIYLSIGHGLVSTGLFFIVGLVYDRYKTRSLHYMSGLICHLPVLTFFAFLLTIANFGFPGSINFLGEFLILINLFNSFPSFTLLLIPGLVISSAYGILLYVRIFLGTFKGAYLKFYSDLSRLEFFTLNIIVVPVFLLGLSPFYFLNFLEIGLNDLNLLISHKLYNNEFEFFPGSPDDLTFYHHAIAPWVNTYVYCKTEFYSTFHLTEFYTFCRMVFYALGLKV